MPLLDLSISTVDAKKVLATLEADEQMQNGVKRCRLDNLTHEERMLRRKLKNRVAAQSARDRKKAHMEELEVALTRLADENRLLKKNNEELRSQLHNVESENNELRSRLGLSPPSSPSRCPTVPKCTATEAALTQQQQQQQQSRKRPHSSTNNNIVTPSVNDHANMVIKTEELSARNEHASLSPLRNCAISTLLFFITMAAILGQRSLRVVSFLWTRAESATSVLSTSAQSLRNCSTLSSSVKVYKCKQLPLTSKKSRWKPSNHRPHSPLHSPSRESWPTNQFPFSAVSLSPDHSQSMSCRFHLSQRFHLRQVYAKERLDPLCQASKGKTLMTSSLFSKEQTTSVQPG